MTLLDRIRALLQADGVPSQDGREEIAFLTKCQNLSVSMRIRLGPDLVLVMEGVEDAASAPPLRSTSIWRILTGTHFRGPILTT